MAEKKQQMQSGSKKPQNNSNTNHPTPKKGQQTSTAKDAASHSNSGQVRKS